jgi:predicted RecB family nuclease
MPYKHLPKFALDNQVRLFGWPVERVPRFPGDPSFDIDKMLKREWEYLWQAVVLDKSIGIEPWSAGTSEFHSFRD